MVKSSEKMEKLMLKQVKLRSEVNLSVEHNDFNMLQPTSNYTDLWVTKLSSDFIRI